MGRLRIADEKEPCVHPRADARPSVDVDVLPPSLFRQPRFSPALYRFFYSLTSLFLPLSHTTRPHQKRNLLLRLLHSRFCRDFAAWLQSIFHSCITLFEISLESFALAQFCIISGAVAVSVHRQKPFCVYACLFVSREEGKMDNAEVRCLEILKCPWGHLVRMLKSLYS
jgi:hypothetical protein